MQKNIFFKIILGIIFICMLFFQNYILFAAQLNSSDREPAVTDLNDILNSFISSVSTSPECYLDTSDIILYGVELIGGIAGIAIGTNMVVIGIPMTLLPEVISQIKGWAEIIGGTASIIAGGLALGKLANDASGQVVCYLSFVRDPVSYYPNFIPNDHPDKRLEGKMKGLKLSQDQKKILGFREVSNYWEALPSNNSNKITICNRSPLFTTGVFSFQGCNGTNQSSWFGSLFSQDGKNKIFANQSDFDGKNSLLCPEEYRQVGRKSVDGEYFWSTKKLECTKYNGNECSTKIPSHQDSLRDFKLTFTGPSCETVEFARNDEKKTVMLNGFKYTAKAKGSRICAFLTHGFTGLVPLSKEWNIGCINKKSFNVSPKCGSSKPIYENFQIDPNTGAISDFGDSTYQVIQYDNSGCINTYNTCGISELCKNHLGGQVFQAPIPITSYIFGCISETSNNIMYGCGGLSGAGMLSVIQQRLWPIVFLMLVLSVIIFSFKILFIDSQIKASTFTVFFIKIAFVIYFTNKTGSGSNTHNGIEIYSGFLSKASTGLQAIVLKASQGEGHLCKYDDSKYDARGQPGKYLYLKPWDILDCRLTYYLTTSFWENAIPFDSNILQNVGAFLNHGISFIVMLLALFFFVIFLFFWVMMIMEIIIVTGILFSLLILLSPIFIPFILFEATKKMFDQWIGKLVTFSLYPVMIFAFLGFCFLMVDRIAFGETEFIKAREQGYVMGRKVDYFIVDDSKDFSSKSSCDGIDPSLIPKGCDCSGANCTMNLFEVKTKDSKSFLGKTIAAEIKTNDSKVVKTLHQNVFSLAFMLFILYHLTKKINTLLDVLSGNSLTLGEVEARSPHSRMEGLISQTGAFGWNPSTKNNKQDDEETKKTTRKNGISGSFDSSAKD